MVSRRLIGHRVYLCGPIDLCPDGGASWREWITPILSDKFDLVVIDPLKKPVSTGLEDDDSRSSRSLLKNKQGHDEFIKIMKEVRSIDLRLVDVSDFLIVNLDVSIGMCGTYEEIFTANKAKRPILIHCPQGVSSIPDWLWACVPYHMFFGNWDSLLEYIRHIDEDQEIDAARRWRFLDHSKMLMRH